MGHKSSKKRAAAAKKAASIILASTSSASTGEVRQEQSKTESHASTSEVRQEQSRTESHASTSEVRQEQSKTESHASMVTECKLALDAREHGEPEKALRILKEVYLHHESCAALAYHIESSVRFGMATKGILMNVLKRIELCRAIDLSDRAVSLSPNSLQFATHYARVLYEAKIYEKAIQECKRAFSIDNPIDPVKDTIPGKSEERRYKHYLTAEERIAYVKEELRDLLHKSEVGVLVNKRRKEIMETLALKEKMKQELGLRTEIEEEEGKLKDTFEHEQKQLAEQNENPGAGWPSQRALEDSILKLDNRKGKMKQELGLRTEIEEEEGNLKDTFEHEQKQLAEQKENPGAGGPSQRVLEDGILKFDNRKLKGKMEEEGKLKDTLEYQQKQLADQNENPGVVNKEIQGRMHVMTREEQVNKVKEQLNKEIQGRMYWTKELDMKIGQLNKEIQQRMDRIKQLDKEVEEDELGYLSF